MLGEVRLDQVLHHTFVSYDGTVPLLLVELRVLLGAPVGTACLLLASPSITSGVLLYWPWKDMTHWYVQKLRTVASDMVRWYCAWELRLHWSHLILEINFRYYRIR